MLELKDVSFKVTVDGQEKEIIKNITMQIPDNKLFVITGPNGGGKSTLAKLIAGIEVPTSGSIVYNGTDITDMSITDRAALGIGFAFQQPVRFKGIQVIDLIKIASPKRITAADACEYLSAVGLCARDYMGREINNSLSGGELKRIEIATVLARGASLAIFDEPEAGIDLWSFRNLIDVFRKMRRTIKNGSILIISHQERILDIADEIIVLKDGSLEKKGGRDEILPSLIGTSAAVAACRMDKSMEGDD